MVSSRTGAATTPPSAAGRLSLNPLRHIDPIGTIVLPIFLIITTGRAFGWAKPVPVNVSRLRHPRNQAVLTALAGPFTNILIAIAAGLALRFLGEADPLSLYQVAVLGTATPWLPGAPDPGEVNAIIAAFNLIPIPPLDGSALVERLLPVQWIPAYYQVRMSFMIIVLVFVFAVPEALDSFFNWVVNLWFNHIVI